MSQPQYWKLASAPSPVHGAGGVTVSSGGISPGWRIPSSASSVETGVGVASCADAAGAQTSSASRTRRRRLMAPTLLSELWRRPGRVDALDELVGQALDRHALLLEGVAVAGGYGPALERLVVDRHPVRRADRVLAAVALANVARLVVLRREARAQLRVDLACELGVAVLAQQREHGDLDRRELRVQPQDRPVLAAEVVLVIGVAQERQHRAVGARGRLDHVRDVLDAGVGVLVEQLLAGALGVRGEV